MTEAPRPVVWSDRMRQALAKPVAAHKFAHGHALVLSGGPGATGAARLAARGALRVGAGLVTLAVPPAALAEAATQVTAVMLRAVPDAAALELVLEDDRFNALCLGPGFGLSPSEAGLIAAALRALRATVLDADALTLMARDARLAALVHDGCVLTPHAGEFARLFPDLADMPDRAASVRAAAERIGGTVLLKGARTLIAGPDGGLAVHDATGARAAPWLATAGSGDVLAGLVCGLMARGLSPRDAAETGVWLHVECARAVGPGLISEDLPEALPAVLRARCV